MIDEVHIREINPDELHLLPAFLYDAIFIPEGVEKPSKDIIFLPQIAVYIDNFGKETDVCLIAEYKAEVIGAVWTRLFTENQKGYGFIDEYTPELCMSVAEQYRGRGIGTAMLNAIIALLKEKGCRQISLSVDVLNYAHRMYQQFGFENVYFEGESVTMIKKL